MGKSNSKSFKNTGDAQVDIVNKLEVHEDYHVDNSIKINIILIVVILLLIVALYQWYRKHTRAQVMRVAKSVMTLQQVA